MLRSKPPDRRKNPKAGLNQEVAINLTSTAHDCLFLTAQSTKI